MNQAEEIQDKHHGISLLVKILFTNKFHLKKLLGMLVMEVQCLD